MSLVVGVIGEDGKVYVGADSAMLTADDGEQMISRVSRGLNPKIFQTNDYIIAGVGSPRILNSLRITDWPELPRECNEDIELATKHVLCSMIPAMQAKCDELGIAMQQTEGALIYPGQYLFAFGGYMFEVGPDLSVLSYNKPYIAIGGSFKVATGALHALINMGLEPEKLIHMTMDAASEHTTMCLPPYTIRSTK